MPSKLFGRCHLPPYTVSYPAVRKSSPIVAMPATIGFPLSITCASFGMRPVKMLLREGEHTGYGQIACENAVPRAASESIAGVRSHGFDAPDHASCVC